MKQNNNIFSQAILKGALSPGHLAAGIVLDETGGHGLVLRCNGHVIATYSATGVYVSEIQNDANEWLERKQI